MPNIQLPAIYQNHMMLQRDKTLHICGNAFGAHEVTISLNDRSITVSVIEDSFYCAFPPQPSGRNKTLSFYLDHSPEASLSFTDISIGDIWMACGQSNMEYFLRYDANWNETKQLPKNEDIHMFNVPRICFEGQTRSQTDCGYWFQEGDSAWPLFSAPGYSFARTIQPELDVPVGIIGCNWGGTPACAWMGEEWLKEEPLSIFNEEYRQALALYSPEELRELSMKSWAFEDSYRHEIEWRAMMYGLTHEEQQLWMKEHEGEPELPMGPYHHYRPSGVYHTMLEPLAPFSVKGILWYQGESDSGHADYYDQTMAALIDCFRKTWKDESLPFLFVQLAPFGQWLTCTGENYAIVRDRQQKAASSIANTGLVTVMDLGSWEDIHPKFKMEVGRRLALQAQKYVYNMPVLADSPVGSSVSLKDKQLTITFAHAEGGLHGDALASESFLIIEADGKPYDLIPTGRQIPVTDCAVSGQDVTLTLERIPSGSVHISYAEQDYCTVHIWNEAGLSAAPFHLDFVKI